MWPSKIAQARAAAGFTMVELLVVLALLGVLASVAFPLTQAVARRNKEAELRHAVREIRTAIDAYKRAVDNGLIDHSADESGYPRQLSDLVNGVANQQSPEHRKVYFLRRLPRDPMTVSDPRWRGQWRLRSYASPPDDPRPGRDVFDIYSASTQRGANGVRYTDW